MTSSTNKLAEYQKEILPMIRNLEYQKALLADFKSSDEKAVALAEAVKDAQKALKDYLDTEEYAAGLQETIKEIARDIKTAIAGAANGEKYKPAELKAYWVAKVKDEGVEKVVSKGTLFVELNGVIGT